MTREAWQIDFTDKDGSLRSVVHLHNAIGDYRAIDPNAVVTRLTEPERVQIPAESEHVASCVAEVPLGYFDQLSKEIKTWPVLDESKFADFPSLLDGMDAPHTPPDGKVACPIPTCRAELLPGQHCGGGNCGLKTKEKPNV